MDTTQDYVSWFSGNWNLDQPDGDKKLSVSVMLIPSEVLHRNPVESFARGKPCFKFSLTWS
jgi:hypothetical protein